MDAKNILNFLKTFNWKILRNMYGCAHNSIIGFVSSGWISQSQHNTILDGAPSPNVGSQRRGQRNADILLFKNEKPYVVTEVESGVSKYCEKINTIQKYLRNIKEFDGLKFGLLIMTNMYDCKKCKHNWDIIANEIKKMKETMAFVSVEKKKVKLGDSTLEKLRSRNDYYPWDVEKIEYWIHTPTRDLRGNLYG
jgi:hypothetical protein